MWEKSNVGEKQSMTEPVKVRGAVIVTRVSGHEQDKNGTSPEPQLAACRLKAASLGLPIVAEYYDAAVSGASLLLRAGMLQAIADIRAGRADTLVSFNIDRFSRHREHQERIKREVQSAGGRLVFCDADYADDAAGNLSFNIRGDFCRFRARSFPRALDARQAEPRGAGRSAVPVDRPARLSHSVKGRGLAGPVHRRSGENLHYCRSAGAAGTPHLRGVRGWYAQLVPALP